MRSVRLSLVVALTLGASAFAITTFSSAASADEITGTLRELHGDDPVNHREVHGGYLLDTGSKLVPVDLPKGRDPGQQLRLSGNFVKNKHGRRFVASTVTVVPTMTPAVFSASAPAGATTRTVAVIQFNFTNDRSQPWTSADARDAMFDQPWSVNAYYQQLSYGKVAIAGDVFGWYPLNVTSTTCDISGWRTAAWNMMSATGVNLANYQYVIYAFPHTTACAFAGMAEMPGTSAWVNGFMDPVNVGHELGHNFGVNHTNISNCTSGGARVTISDSCANTEYGDPFSIMGSGVMSLDNNWHRAELGWLDNMQTVTASGTYTLSAADNPGSSAPLLRIPRANSYLNLEYRQPHPGGTPFNPYNSTDPVANGVTIRVAPEPTGQIVPTQLLDATPETASFFDAALPAGRTFNDQYGTSASGVRITTVSVTPTSATIQVQFPVVTPPSTTTTTTPPVTTTTKPPVTTTTKPPVTTTTKPPVTTTTKPPTTTTTTTTTAPPPPPSTTQPPPPTGAAGPPGLVRPIVNGTKSQAGNASITVVVPAGGGAVAGHRVIVAAGVGTFGGAVGCQDSRGNVYAIDGRSSANNLFVCSAYVSVALQAGDTITLTYPGFSGVSVATAYDFAGIAPGNAVDGALTAASTSSKNVSVAPPLVTSAPNELLFAAVAVNSPFTPGSGFSPVGSFGGVNTAFLVSPSTGPFSVLGTIVSGAWRAVLVAYRTA